MTSWKSISLFGNNQIINKSYVYLFLVPILAKFFSKIKSPFAFTIDNKVYEMVLDLPFNWIMFFLSALIFTLASIIYTFLAPSIIKENKSYGAFLIDRKGWQHIISYAEEMGISEKWYEEMGMARIDSNEISSLQKYAREQPEKFNEETKIDPKVILKEENVKKIRVQKVIRKSISSDGDIELLLQPKFWSVYNYANYYRKTARIICFFLYVLGFFFISVVVIQGSVTVFKML